MLTLHTHPYLPTAAVSVPGLAATAAEAGRDEPRFTLVRSTVSGSSPAKEQDADAGPEPLSVEVVLDVLERYERQHGFFPDTRELPPLIGRRSSSAAFRWIERLAHKGWITKRPKGVSLRIAKVTPLGRRRLEEWRRERGR